MKQIKLLIIIFTILFLPNFTIPEDNLLNSTFQKIKSVFLKNNYTSLESLFPKDRKIYIFIPTIIEKNGYFTAQQIHFILKDMEQNLITEKFNFDNYEPDTPNSNSTIIKANWEFIKDKQSYSISLFFYLEKIDKQWKLLEIKIS